jgi:exopolysaccharide biosynthesis polyprenyl glycosylphosphotransferase
MDVTHHRKLEIPNLRRRLVLLDSIALLVSWVPVLAWKYTAGMELWKLVILEAVLFTTGLVLFMKQGLYLARVASSRAEEIRRIVRSSIILGVLQAGLLKVMGVELATRWLLAGPLISVVLLLWFRGGYRAWLSAQRAAGHHLRDVIVVGANADASDLVDLLRDHPEAGFRVRGVVGDPSLAAVNGMSSLHLGRTSDLLDLLDHTGIRGVITVAGALPSRDLTPLISELEHAGIHIQISTGLHGMSHRRLRATPVAYQSLYYLEPSDTTSPQLLLKRLLDLVLAIPVLIVAAPVIAIIAVVIKATDAGPVLFKQRRVGRDGVEFDMYKFRSMVVDAESRLSALTSDNQRVGPLFKIDHDPRVTPIGRFLRATSLDELPQLINVLWGEMSIVGPRPALPAEVAQFDDRLLDRLRMPPGMTGLWQVEARDNPHFGAYRRLDLFYVDNWSLNLDFVILVATFEQVLSKAWRTLTGGTASAAVVEMAPTQSDAGPPDASSGDVLRSA